MAEIHRVLENFPPKLSGLRGSTKAKESATPKASFSDIPDIFFDEILQNYRLARQEIQILLYFYRQVWSKPNLYKKYGLREMGLRKNYYSDNREDALIMTSSPIQEQEFQDLFCLLAQNHQALWGKSKRTLE